MIHLHLVALLAALSGSWSISPSSVPGYVHLGLRIEDGTSHHESDHDVTPSSIGLTQQQLDSGHRVTFSIARDAGTFACDGWLSQSKGGGSLVFSPSPAFERGMNDRGYDVTPDQQATAAMLDLSLTYIDTIAAAGFKNLPFEKLVAFRALNIDDAYARAMRTLFGDDNVDADQLIALKALGVTQEYVSAMRAAGTTVATARQAVQLRALKVDPQYVRDMAAAGYPHLTPNQLVQLRAMEIDAAYVQRVKDHGFPHPSIDDLVRMKAMKII
jgi:hypothetical protein